MNKGSWITFIPKSLSKAKIYEITPLFNENEVSKIASNNFFLVSGNWYYVSYTSEGNLDKHKIPKFKENMEIIAAYHNGNLAEFYHWYFSKDIEDRFLLIILVEVFFSIIRSSFSEL